MSRQRKVGAERRVLACGIAGDATAVFHILFVSAAVFAGLSTGLGPAIFFHTLCDSCHPILAI